MKKDLDSSEAVRPSPAALLPLFLFLGIFLGSGVYFHLQGTAYAFYQISTPVAVLPAIFLAVVISREGLGRTINSFLEGAGDINIMAMCMIYLLAGAFSSVAQATGGVDAVVGFALGIIPDYFLIPGLFMVSAFISTAMGTSMGTIAAIAPIALGVGKSAGLPLELVAGSVLGGAMFGDNLSVISDTTIAATRSQGCDMRDKFRVNIYIATPAALATIALLALTQGTASVAPPSDASFFSVLPYLVILLLALCGLNVFAVLVTGLTMAGFIGITLIPDYSVVNFAKDTYAGFTKMQEIFILSILIGGLGALMKNGGGLAFLRNRIETLINRFSRDENGGIAAELGIALMVTLTNMCTANNTVSIIVSGGVAKDIADRNNVAGKRSASIMDIFSCVCQGLLPYAAQTLLVASIIGVSPLMVMKYSWYCMLLAVCGVTAIIINGLMNKRTS